VGKYGRKKKMHKIRGREEIERLERASGLENATEINQELLDEKYLDALRHFGDEKSHKWEYGILSLITKGYSPRIEIGETEGIHIGVRKKAFAEYEKLREEHSIE
jgi:hypothetical protein